MSFQLDDKVEIFGMLDQYKDWNMVTGRVSNLNPDTLGVFSGTYIEIIPDNPPSSWPANAPVAVAIQYLRVVYSPSHSMKLENMIIDNAGNIVDPECKCSFIKLGHDMDCAFANRNQRSN